MSEEQESYMRSNSYASSCSCGVAVPAKAGVVVRGRVKCNKCYLKFHAPKPEPAPRGRRRIYYPR